MILQHDGTGSVPPFFVMMLSDEQRQSGDLKIILYQNAILKNGNPGLAFYRSVLVKTGSSINNVVTLPFSRWKRSIHQRRSEEHTSELQSLMRTTYAVFCS